MKKQILTLSVFMCMAFSAYASLPTEDVTLINNTSLEVTVAEIAKKQVMLTAQFSENILSFETNEKIKYIQIFTESGRLQYQLPILSQKVQISKGLFESGAYTLTFTFTNNNKPISSKILIK